MLSHKVSAENILDPALIALNSLYDPDPDNKQDLEIKNTMLGLHQSFQSLQSIMRSSNGIDEDVILGAISDVICSAAKLAVAYEHHRVLDEE